MKNLKYLFLVMGFLLFSCENILEEDPRSLLVRENFYQNEGDALAALNAVYSVFSQDGGYPTIWFMSLLENRAEYSNGRGSQAGISIYDIPLDNTNQSRAFDAYNDLFLGINRANAVISNVPSIDMQIELRDQIVAEARFLRAFFYSTLVKYWGGVPLRLEEFISLDQVAAPRETVDDIWTFVINELESIIPDLASAFSEGESGRATSWAAKAALADAYLNIEDWIEAASVADDIINSGPFSLVEVDVADDFSVMFGPDVITHSEDIMSVHHSGTNGNFVATFIHRANTGFSVNGFHAWLPLENSILGSSWDTNDLRQQFNMYSSYIDENGDVQMLPDSSPLLFHKYRDPNAPADNQNRNNIPLFRLAEAYLVYAEAASEANGGPTSLALERLNIIRRRGYGLPLNIVSAQDYPSNLTAAEFKEKVLIERAYEFPLEMKRWNDLLRNDLAQEKVEATGKAWSDISLLFPLPINEINNNPALTAEDQNPGY